MFGTAKIGLISSPNWDDAILHAGIPVTEDMLMGDSPKALPEAAELKIRISTASGPPSTSSDSFYFDGAHIIVRNADLCAQLARRLEKLWGPPEKWSNPARNQAARLDQTASPGVSCALDIFRTPTVDAAHCLPDENTLMYPGQEIDVERRCLKAERPRVCELVRYSDRYLGPPWNGPNRGRIDATCHADDDAHHKFYAGDVPSSVEHSRSCIERVAYTRCNFSESARSRKR